MTQKEIVLEKLRSGPLCSFAFYYEAGLTHRMGARIHELRREGFAIVNRPCESHSHDAPAVEYLLVGDRLFV